MQPVIMLLMSGFFMFAVIGGISLLAHYYTLNGIKSKTVGDGAAWNGPVCHQRRNKGYL